MSYIQIEIGGKPRGLKFNQGAFIWFQGKIDRENIAATTGYALIWSGLKANAYVKGEEFTETFEQVCDWVDELDPEVILKVITVFQETQVFKSMLADDDKKKSPSKNTKRNVSK